MAKFTPHHEELKDLFDERSIGLQIPDGFLETMIGIATNYGPVMDSINSKKGINKFYMTDKILDNIKRDYSRAIMYDAAAFLTAIRNSNNKFSTEYTVLFEPNNNFHSSDIFHHVIVSILKQVASCSSKIYICPQIIHKRKCLFCTDKIHLSTYGQKKLFRLMNGIIKIFASHLSKGSTDFDKINSDINDYCRRHNPSKSSCCEANKCKLTKRPPLDKKFNETHYEPYENSGKLLGFWSSHSKLNDKGIFPLASLDRDHLIIIHATSMFRCFIDNSIANRTKRIRRSLLSVPAAITISPGASAKHIALDLKQSLKIKCYERTAFLSAFYYGSNEKIHLENVIDSHLCDKGLISIYECSICQFKSRGKTNYQKIRNHCSRDKFVWSPSRFLK